MSKATVIPLDIAQNFITKHQPEVYFSHLGILKYATRLQEPNGIYYSQTGGFVSMIRTESKRATENRY